MNGATSSPCRVRMPARRTTINHLPTYLMSTSQAATRHLPSFQRVESTVSKEVSNPSGGVDMSRPIRPKQNGLVQQLWEAASQKIFSRLMKIRASRLSPTSDQSRSVQYGISSHTHVTQPVRLWNPAWTHSNLG
jgi:hypothetical protein